MQIRNSVSGVTMTNYKRLEHDSKEKLETSSTEHRHEALLLGEILFLPLMLCHLLNPCDSLRKRKVHKVQVQQNDMAVPCTAAQVSARRKIEGMPCREDSLLDEFSHSLHWSKCFVFILLWAARRAWQKSPKTVTGSWPTVKSARHFETQSWRISQRHLRTPWKTFYQIQQLGGFYNN